MHYVSLRRSLCMFPCGICFHVECHPASVPVQVMWQLGRDTSHVPAGLQYPRGFRLGRDQGIWMASQICLHDRFANGSFSHGRYVVRHCLAGKTVREIDRTCGPRTYSKYHSGLLVYPVVQPSQYSDVC